MSDSDSEDDLGAFAFLATTIVVDDDEQAQEEAQDNAIASEQTSSASKVIPRLEELLLLRDVESLESLDANGGSSATVAEVELITMCRELLAGKHLEVLQEFSPQDLSLAESLSLCMMEGDCVAQIRGRIFSYVGSGEDEVARECRSFQCLVLAVTYLELYCQENYTGPQLDHQEVEKLYRGGEVGKIGDYDAFMERVQSMATRNLEWDGNYCFPHCVIPHVLVIARSILLTLGDPQRAHWHRGIVLDDEGDVLKSQHNRQVPSHVYKALTSLRFRQWHCARSVMIHARLLQQVSQANVPTLWKESQDHLGAARRILGIDDLSGDRGTDSEYRVRRENGRIFVASNCGTSGGVGSKGMELSQALLATQLLLESGLSYHHFQHGDQGKRFFAHAQRVSGLFTELSGAMGKRTKYQQDEHAQLFLRAKSSLMALSEAPSATTATTTTLKPPVAPAPEHPTATELGVTQEHENGWQHSEWEVGRGLLREVEVGEGQNKGVAAVREVLLDTVDGGPQENILLEGGPAYTNIDLDKGGTLHPVDQAVVLALCIDVSNSNPDDGLTREEMEPYLQRVLALARNWMIHSTGLLERSWLEFEKRRTMDRAMLQIQALLDQHTTKLTIMQSTYKAVHDESAPVQDRLAFLHCIVYPSQYELKRDLAHRYLSCNVVASALQYFKELHLWNEVVTCYQLMQKPHRAEMVVRERIQEEGKTPYMLTALADLTEDTSLYEEAWELSEGRYARAKRTLAKICFDKGELESCVKHATLALAVQPLVATAWYIKGLACIRLERFEEALNAFGRCIQQDQEQGEAWANCGSIHMHLGDYDKAHSAMEQAYRFKRDSWRVVENLMNTSLQLGKWVDCVNYMSTLLAMREKSERPLHKEELRRLSLFVAAINREEVRVRRALIAEKGEEEGREAAASIQVIDTTTKGFMEQLRVIVEKDEEDGQELLIILDDDLSYPARQLEAFYLTVTSTLSSDPEVWDLFANFEVSLGRLHIVLECRVKQYRALLTQPRWEKHEEQVVAIVRTAGVLVAVHSTTMATRDHLYACKSMLVSTKRKIATLFAGSEHDTTITALIVEVEDIALKRGHMI